MSEIKVSFDVNAGCLVVSYSNTPGDGNYIRLDQVEPLRRALNARHKARKAAKKEERRFGVATRQCADGYIAVLDNENQCEGSVATFLRRADARAFAKMLNKRNRKAMGAKDA